MPPADKLLLRGVRLFGRHGVHSAEQSLGQLFRVDVQVEANLTKPCRSDDFRDTLDYVKLFDIVKHVIEGPPKHLVEAVAQDIADRVFDNLPLADTVKIRVEKPHVAIPGVLDGVGVEIFRER